MSLKEIFGQSFNVLLIEKYMNRLADKIPAIVLALLILLVGVYVSSVIKRIVKRILSKYDKANDSLIHFMVSAVHVLILIFVFLMCLDMMGIKTTSFITVIGATGFSIGLAFKDILGNLGSAMVLLFFKPFNLGDYIQLPSQNIEGTVMEIQIFSTIIKTNNNKTVIIPNSMLTNNELINATDQNIRRMDLKFVVSYDTDIEVLNKISDKIISAEERFEKNPKPLIGVENITNGSIVYVVRPWIRTDIYWDVYYEVMGTFLEEFKKNNIKFPKLMSPL